MRGDVAGITKNFGEGEGGLGEPQINVVEVFGDIESKRVAASEKRGAGWRADGGGGVEVSGFDALGGEAIEVRGLDRGAAEGG